MNVKSCILKKNWNGIQKIVQNVRFPITSCKFFFKTIIAR